VTDLYSLGVVMHELLTGSLPVVGVPLRRVELSDAQAAARGVPSVVALRRSFTPELDAVLQRCLQADPKHRHAGADALAEDIRQVLAGRLPAAAPQSMRRRLVLFVRRHRVSIAAAALTLAGLLAAGGLALNERINAREQESRLSQVRLFMLTTLTDVEPLEGHPAETMTGLELLQAALQRARTSFASEPTLRAEVFNEIAIMLRRFDRPQEGLALLREANALMEKHAKPDDPGRNILAAQLAGELLAESWRTGDAASLAAVRPLGLQALASCTADSTRCAKARHAACAALSNLASYENDNPKALSFGRRAVVEADRGFGRPHAEGTMARVYLALLLRNAGELQEADQVLAEADAAARQAPLRSGDAMELRTAKATLQGDLGRHAQALQTLHDMLADIKPDSPSAAVVYRLRAQSEHALGLLADALVSTQRALDAAARHEDTWDQVSALAIRARAFAAMGQAVAAQESLQAWRAAVAKLGGPATGVQPRACGAARPSWHCARGRSMPRTSGSPR
jgi:tetratricopeptide (TPR) repeat protein